MAAAHLISLAIGKQTAELSQVDWDIIEVQKSRKLGSPPVVVIQQLPLELNSFGSLYCPDAHAVQPFSTEIPLTVAVDVSRPAGQETH